MQNRQLYIEDQLADLEDSQPVALTLQVNDIATLGDRQSGYSNTLKLPLTRANKAIFGYADSGNFTQMQPYRMLTAKYIEDGVEVVPIGQIILKSVNATFEAVLTFGAVSFASLIDGKILQDLDLTPYGTPDPDDFQGILDSQAKTTGWLWPVINYGVLGDESLIDTRYLWPAWYRKTLMEAIETMTGYKFSGLIFKDSAYQSEIIPFANDQFKNENNGATDLPDISIKDFLKDFMQAYFLTPIVDNVKKTIVFKSFDELYNNKSKADDWTHKFLNSPTTAKFAFGDYAQLNKLLYKDDNGVPDGLGEDVFTIDNTTLTPKRELIKRPFAATVMDKNFVNIIVSQIIRQAIGGAKVSTQPRVLYNRFYQASGYFTFTNGSNKSELLNKFSLPYFTLEGFKGLGWGELVNRYGYGFLKMLKKARVESREVLLSPVDVQQLDFFVPKYDARNGAYYYVNRVYQWQSGKSCTVDLVWL